MTWILVGHTGYVCTRTNRAVLALAERKKWGHVFSGRIAFISRLRASRLNETTSGCNYMIIIRQFRPINGRPMHPSIDV